MRQLRMTIGYARSMSKSEALTLGELMHPKVMRSIGVAYVLAHMQLAATEFTKTNKTLGR